MKIEQNKWLRGRFLKIIGLASLLLFFGACKQEQKNKVIEEQLVDKVYPLLDTENSRWFFFSSASRPFGMVNLSPDTEIKGAWGSGYRYKTDTIKGFSHIHAWQMAGLSVMPVTLNSDKASIFSDFYSKFSHETEQITPGYHSLTLDRYHINTTLTSSKRVGFHKYQFPEASEKGILFNLNTFLGPCENIDGSLTKITNKEFSGTFIMTPTRRRPKPLKVFFKAQLNSPIEKITKDDTTGNYLLQLSNASEEVLMKIGISYTSLANATANIAAEIPHWNFNEVVTDAKEEWNTMLGRIQIKGGTTTAQRRFYTDLWHSLQGRRTISDANGAYPDYTGENFRIGQLPLDAVGKPKFNHYNSDSFWGAQWTINTLWGLVYPDIMNEFTQSLMQYYKDGGAIPRGPSGGNYTFVMTGASSTPFIVSAIQKGIVNHGIDSIYLALKKNHSVGGIMEKAGYEHNTNLGGGFSYYLKNGYAPSPIPEGDFGLHQDGSGLTLEYAYQDWTLAQLAKKMNLTEDYTYFLKRAKNYQNVFNKEKGWMSAKDVSGNWLASFDPYEYEQGFVEANPAQATWFVPHDLEGLATLMGGKEKAVEKLQTQFTKAAELNFTSGSSHEKELHPEFKRIPINYGNQPAIQTAFIFNFLDRPELTQYWSRAVIQKSFSGLSPSTGYSGDEDQGLMGSLNVLMKIGLFQMNGGTDEDPTYQIGSPIFDEVVIKLHPKYYADSTFTIKAAQTSPQDIYVKGITLNNKEITNFSLSHSDIVKGGELVLKMSPSPD
ncbi:MAG: alpha-mannosidase [Flavobacteriaceae bacterium]|nr:MAG: alpha-mannosidase [Flavobacteriaceae bacterium]